MGIISGIEDFIKSFLPQSPQPESKVKGNPQDMKLTVGVSPNLQHVDSPVQQFAQSTVAPSPVAQFAQSTQPGGFKYRMGSSDYSDVAPQVQNVLKGTPLEPYANDFIQAGNKHHVDPRVLVTVAHNESSLGKNYPIESYNPFGYNARSAGMITGLDGKQYVNVDAGLKSAGFTSLPMAIDRLTQRFSDHPVNPTGQGYTNFRQDPSVENLQAAYNASDAEKANYIKNSQDFVHNFE